MKRTEKRREVPTVRHPLTGTWVQQQTDPDFPITSVEFTISLREGGFEVRARDTSDGEELEVSRVRWNGEDRKFSTFCASTKWKAKHVFRINGGGLAEHEVTYTESEIWGKRPSSPTRRKTT